MNAVGVWEVQYLEFGSGVLGMYLGWSGVTWESQDTSTGYGCLQAVCHPRMYLGWSGVTRESRDTWRVVWKFTN